MWSSSLASYLLTFIELLTFHKSASTGAVMPDISTVFDRV